MKTILALISAALLISVSTAWADASQRNNVNNQNFSRRPHVQVPEAKPAKAENFEGATLVEEEAENVKKYKTLQLHMLGRRPYAEKTPD